MARRNANTYHWQRYRIEEQATQSLPFGNLSFRMYLSAHHLVLLDVARRAGVRYLTAWNVEHDISILSDHAALVRTGLQCITGIAYTGPIAVHAVDWQGNGNETI